ncbi:unnamed protein product [Arabis nemorensis]|uniref:Uncharacterized protein n=1 Tax=Arabis nemorensis TaxID=586526 RepID=A0A565CAA7_9BRAS|nr:unnamed protein product [Arabis nemorensis]
MPEQSEEKEPETEHAQIEGMTLDSAMEPSKMVEEVWRKVSPEKAGRHSESIEQITNVGISPSRFSVLEETEESNDHIGEEEGDQLEEGEVLVQNNSPKEKGKPKVTEEPSTCACSNRIKKGTNAKALEPYIQAAKPIPPNASGKRGKKQ